MSTPWGSRLTWVVAGGVLLAVCVVGWLVWATDRDFTSEEVDVAAEQVVGGPEDCWGGALDGEPMACYVLEHAQADGALEVAGVFLAPSGPLYVILDRSEPIDEDLLWVLESRYKEYATTPELDQNIAWDRLCGVRYSVENCVEEWTVDRLWMLLPQGGVSLFSGFTSTHDDVLVLHGGLPARQKVPGWASWAQLWPAPSEPEFHQLEQSVEAAAGAPTGGFDVSDVDVVSGLADEDCESHGLPVSDGMCLTWRTYGYLGFVGMYGTRDYFPGETPTDYIQVKSPPSDPQEIERIKVELLDDYERVRYEAGEFKMELVPVMYDLGELWRWAVVLDRFKYSKGNTIGLMGAWVGTNGVVLNDPANIRITINVRGLDPRVVADALPELLPALNIPTDAVGRVIHYETDQRQYLLERPDAPQSMASEPAEIIIPTDGDSVRDASDGDGAAVVVDSSGSSASGSPSGAARALPDADDPKEAQREVSGTSSEGGGVASGGSHADPQGMAASRGSGGSVEGSEAQSLATSSEVAQSGSSGSADGGGGLSVWWLMGLAAMGAVAAIGGGVLWSRRA